MITADHTAKSWKRSASFKRPWRLSERGYGRYPRAIVDADGDVIILLDRDACTTNAMRAIIKAANG